MRSNWVAETMVRAVMNPMPVDETRQGYVYVLECQGLYKIGFSVNPTQRLNAYYTHNPFPVRLVGVLEGTMADELVCHAHFASKRIRAEWFALDPDDIAGMRLSPPAPTPLGPADPTHATRL